MNKYVLSTGMMIAGVSSVVAASSEKPNIMFIFADDMIYSSIAAHGNNEIITPNLDRLVNRGTTFTHAYNMGSTSGAVCMCSRSMINTGMYLANAMNMKKKKSNPQWADLMNTAGYTTYMTGKWHVPGLSTDSFDVVKNERPGMPRDTYDVYLRPTNEEEYQKGWKPWDPSKGGFWEGGEHWSKVLADDSVSFINQAKEDDNPFFMYLAFNAPHDPRQAPKEYVDMYPLDKISVPESYLTEHPNKDDIACGEYVRDERLMPFPRTEYSVKRNIQEYYASITYMDVQIGRILDELEKSGKADNTYIFFTADHGLAIGRHGLCGKQNLYEHSMRPPFMVTGPGVKAGAKIDAPIYLQDVMATSLDIAGLKKPKHVEFKSIMPLIRGKKDAIYDSIFGMYKEFQRSVVKDGWKLMIFPKAQRTQLFNIANDEHELNDLSGNPEYAHKILELRKELVKQQKIMGDKYDINTIPQFSKFDQKKMKRYYDYVKLHGKVPAQMKKH